MSPTVFVFSAQSPQGAQVLGIIAKRAYRLAYGRLVPDAVPPPFHEAPEYAPPAQPQGTRAFVADSDYFAAVKPSTDVLVRGSGYSTRGPVRMLDTAVSVGPMRKRVRAWGERAMRVMPGGALSFSQPEPFTEVPLTWELAYGGRDEHAEKCLLAPRKRFAARRGERGRIFAYPRNRWGRGYFLNVDIDRLEGQLAPRLEVPEEPVEAAQILAADPCDWKKRPAAACYAPMDCATFPRAAWAVRSPGTPLDARIANCAPSELCGARLQGNERVCLMNMHPKRELFELELPGERPRLLLEPPGCSIQDLPALLQTVLIEPAEERVTLTWAAALDVLAPYPAEMCRDMRRAVRWEK